MIPGTAALPAVVADLALPGVVRPGVAGLGLSLDLVLALASVALPDQNEEQPLEYRAAASSFPCPPGDLPVAVRLEVLRLEVLLASPGFSGHDYAAGPRPVPERG